MSRSRSRDGDTKMDQQGKGGGSSGRGEYDTEVMDIEDADAAFVLGRSGSTKTKIAKVSGARLDLDENKHTLEIGGTPDARRRARDYIGYVLSQRTGDVYIDLNEQRDDLSVVTVPEDCVGYVMGKGGQVLRQMEQEWGTLMFFAKVKEDTSIGEKLAIFGTKRGRRGSELKVMSAVEHKHPGYYISSDNDLKEPLNQPGDDDPSGDWGYDTYFLSEDEFSYALGSYGTTRKKLAAASNCIMEYVGTLAILAGYRDERQRAMDYLKWLLAQRKSSCVVDTQGREDFNELDMPSDSVGFVTGHKGEGLRNVEKETDTFCFTNGERGSDEKHERLLIFGAFRSNRKKAKEKIEDKIRESQDRDRGGGSSRGRGRDDYRDRGRGRRKDDRSKTYEDNYYDDYDKGGKDSRKSRSRSKRKRRSRSKSRHRSPSYSEDYSRRR
jgi:predicted RNA-binding protein Jag